MIRWGVHDWFCFGEPIIEFEGMTVQILFEGNLGVIMKLITQGFRLRGPCGTAIGTPTHERD